MMGTIIHKNPGEVNPFFSQILPKRDGAKAVLLLDAPKKG